MNKKFYQNYTLNTVEEALAIATLFENSIGNLSEMLLGNLFTKEELVGKDNVDLSNCYLVSDELYSTLEGLTEEYDTFSDILVNYKDLDSSKALDILKSIKNNMIGNTKLSDAISRDRDTFGRDVDFYFDDPFVSIIRFIELLG